MAWDPSQYAFTGPKQHIRRPEKCFNLKKSPTIRKETADKNVRKKE